MTTAASISFSKDLIEDFRTYLKRRGYKPRTASTIISNIRRLRDLGLLGESVGTVKRELIRQGRYCESTLSAYRRFLEFLEEFRGDLECNLKNTRK